MAKERDGRNAELRREICRVSGLRDTEQTKGTRKIERDPRVERENRKRSSVPGQYLSGRHS